MKYLVLALFIINFGLSALITSYYSESKERHETYSSQESIKNQAFIVLRDKCNVCHATKKKTDVFTLENMDSLAAPIHKQVFIKKKMPKGRKVKLTDEERQSLQKWLSTTLENYESID